MWEYRWKRFVLVIMRHIGGWGFGLDMSGSFSMRTHPWFTIDLGLVTHTIRFEYGPTSQETSETLFDTVMNTLSNDQK